MQKIWKVKEPDIALQERLVRELGISAFLSQLLINRNITTACDAKSFLDSDINSLHNPGLLPDIAKAKNRIQKALKNKEKVLLFSDYDADGLTSLAVLKSAFDKLGLSHEHYLPHRLKEGYGLSAPSVKYAHSHRFSLVVTLDCGISNFKEIAELKGLNIDVIVIDHHQVVLRKLPAAYAIINPKRQGSQYPYQDLAGVGLSYKFASYLLNSLEEETLDLVCLGTIADVVPLLGENRILIKEGLKCLNNTKRPGLKSLIDISGIKNKTLNTEHVSYILAPRINACGRIDSCEAAFELLLCSCDDKARLLAGELHSKNRERQSIQGKVLDEALSRLESEIDLREERVIVLHQDGWHRGVLGIVAAKIADRFYRPAIVISFTDEMGRGSGRSIENFHLFESLLECGQHLEGFGGHKRACGLSILKNNLEGFKKSINRIAQRLSPEDLLPSLSIDLKIGLSDLGQNLLQEISLLEPFGQDNPKPLLVSYGLKIKSKPTILGRDTLKLWVSDGRVTYPAIGFGMGRYFDLVNSTPTVNLAYRISLDNWNGNSQLQLEIEDIHL